MRSTISRSNQYNRQSHRDGYKPVEKTRGVRFHRARNLTNTGALETYPTIFIRPQMTTAPIIGSALRLCNRKALSNSSTLRCASRMRLLARSSPRVEELAVVAG